MQGAYRMSNNNASHRHPRTLGLLFALASLLWPLVGSARDAAPLSADDIAWLRRDTFGLDSATIERYREIGRARFLDEQLSGGDGNFPAPINRMINGYEVMNTSPEQLVMKMKDEQQAVKDAPDGDQKEAAKKVFQQHRRSLYREAAQVELLHTVYGSNQLKEQMVWFWLNHFSIYAAKAGVGLFAADYEENVIRPHALGSFKDLVMATLKSPAMLLYLDNAKNIEGKTNENYARELMELHTLGVNQGYTQQDVQQLTLILTGAGVAPKRGVFGGGLFRQQPGIVRDGFFVFNPNKHNSSDKTFLGQSIERGGFDEIEKAVDLIVQQPACAKYISRQIAQYFVAEDPPPALVDAMATTFQNTNGNIAAVLRTMFMSKALTENYGKKFKDPTQFMASAMRLAYDGKPISNAAPLLNWVAQMGEPVYGRITPDGYALDGASWSGSGQMAKRFDVAKAIGSGRNRLFASGDDSDPLPPIEPPTLNSPLYQQTLEPRLSADTRTALSKAVSPGEWNTFLLSSPDFNYR
jgi:uncharacterized protein (DUF1800 family)